MGADDLRSVLGLICTLHAISQEMQRNVERLKAEFLDEAKVLESEVVLVNISSKVSTNELLAAIVESTNAIRASIVGKSRPLQDVLMLVLGKSAWIDLRAGPPDEISFGHA